MNAIVPVNEIDIDEISRIGNILARSGYFDQDANKEVAVAQMCVKVLAGRELGFGPFASANGIHIIKGKPSIGAHLIASAVKASGKYTYDVLQMDANGVSIEFFELRNGEWKSVGVSTFTAKDASSAGTQNMQKYGRNMMFARAMSNGQRWYAPDVFSGNAVYVPEELGAEVDGETGEIVQGKYKVVQERPAAPAPVARTQRNDVEELLRDVDEVEAKHHGYNADAEWEEWQGAVDAYLWAVSVGACANEFEARASMTKVINSNESWGGRLHRGNKEAVYAAFFARQMEKLNEEPGADAEELAPF